MVAINNYPMPQSISFPHKENRGSFMVPEYIGVKTKKLKVYTKLNLTVTQILFLGVLFLFFAPMFFSALSKSKRT